MPVKVLFKMGASQLLYQQSTTCMAEVQNKERLPLARLNWGTPGGSPTLLLKDALTGEVSTYRNAAGGMIPPPPLDVSPGENLIQEFYLADRLQFPAAGRYELQALYEWIGGNAASAPIKVEVRESRPSHVYLATTYGGIGGQYLAVWINNRDPEKEQYELWLSQIATSGRPSVRQCTHLTDLKKPVEAVLSVPANHAPEAQWVAWVEEDNLYALLHRNGEASRPQVSQLNGLDCRIIPPLLLSPSTPQEKLPGADVLLYEPRAEPLGGRLWLMHVGAYGSSPTLARVPLPGSAPFWAKTAYFSTLKRQTFFLCPDQGRCALLLSAWSAAKPPEPPKQVAAWSAHFLAADVNTNKDDEVRGALLGEMDARGSGRYAFYPWAGNERGEVVAGTPIPLAKPADWRIARAVLRVDQGGAPHALFQADDKEKTWFFAAWDGTITPLPGPLAKLRPPAEILFRYGDDPTILYAEPGLGFQFSKPSA